MHLVRWVALWATAALLFAAEEGRRETPSINAGGVVNAASFVPAPDNFVAPNSIVSIFGADLALGTAAVTSDSLEGGRLPLSLGGVSVLVGGQRTPLYFVSPTQINAQLPAALVGRPQPWEMTVVREGLATTTMVHVRESAPGLFGVIAHADFSVVGRGEPPGSTPAAPREVVILFGTGFGPTQPPVEEGQLPPFGAPATLPRRVFIGGEALPDQNVLYFGQAPFLAGVYQVNVWLPGSLRSGDYEVRVEVAGALSQRGVFLAIEDGVE